MTDTTALEPGLTRQLDELWAGQNIDLAAQRVAYQLVQSAEVLPLTVFLGARVFPLVVWNPEALRSRIDQLRHPMLDRDLIQGRHGDPGWPTVLKIAGFIGVGRPAQVRRELSGMRAVARTIGMFPGFPARSPLVAEEFDLQGTALVIVGEDGVEVHVGGDGGAKPGSDLAPLWRRAFEERLFWWATHTSRWPQDPTV